MLADGSLIIHRGRLVALRASGADLEVVWKDGATQENVTLTVRRVINCIGPASDYSRVDLPLIATLRWAGWLAADPLSRRCAPKPPPSPRSFGKHCKETSQVKSVERRLPSGTGRKSHHSANAHPELPTRK